MQLVWKDCIFWSNLFGIIKHGLYLASIFKYMVFFGVIEKFLFFDSSSGHCYEHVPSQWTIMKIEIFLYLKCSVLCCGCNIFISYLIQALCSAMMSPFNMMYEEAICEVISRMLSSTCVLDLILTKLFNLYLPWPLQETRTVYFSLNSGISQIFWNPNHIVYRNGTNVSFGVVYNNRDFFFYPWWLDFWHIHQEQLHPLLLHRHNTKCWLHDKLLARAMAWLKEPVNGV